MREKTIPATLAALAAVALLAACAAYRHQHTARPAGSEPAAPAVTSTAPAAEFRDLPEGEQLARVRGEAEELKANLARQGKYACCVQPACNECLLNRGECHCRHEVREGGPCCGECTEAWLEGRGAVEGIDAWELLERRKKAAGGDGHQHHHR